MIGKSYEIPEPVVNTRVRVYAEKLDMLWLQQSPRPVSVCEGRSIQSEGSPWEQCLAALQSRSVRGPFPVSSASTVLILQQTTSGPELATTWRIDIAVTNGAAHAQVLSTRPRIDLGPILVSARDDVVAVAIKMLQAGHEHTV